MTYSLNNGPSTFWTNADQSLNGLVVSDGLHMVMLRTSASMRVLLRSTEDLFTNAAPRLAGSPIVIVNGNFYDVTLAGRRDAFLFNDGAEPAETTPLGRLINRGVVIGGMPQSQMFHFGKVNLPFVGPQQQSAPPIPPSPTYFSGFGLAPTSILGQSVVASIGGAGPLIINGLQYGNGNHYRAGAPGATPVTGAPPAASQPFLTQRNNNTFISANGLPVGTGKTVLAANNARGRLLVCVQENGTSGQRLSYIRDRLVALGFDQAVFLDGSDSSCLWHGGSWRISPGEYKDETNTIGIAFG